MAIQTHLTRGAVAPALAVAALLATNMGVMAHSPAAPAWQPMPPLPAPNAGQTAVRMPDSSVLALGGDPAMGTTARMAARLATPSGTWQRLPDAPAPLDTPAALALTNHAVLVVAPSYASGTMASPSAALLLDPLWKRWTALPSCPVALFAPRLLRLDSHTILAAGGTGRLLGATLNLTTLTWTVLPSPIADIASYTLADLTGKGALIMASVAINQQHKPFAVRRAWLLSPNRAWHEIARPPLAMDGAQAVLLSPQRVLFAGGYPVGDDPRLPAPPSLIYHADTDRWSIAGSTGDDHRGAQLVALSNGRTLLVGGHGPDGQPTTSCLLFDGVRWQTTRSLPGPWSAYALTTLPNGGVLLIGGDRPVGNGFAPVADTMLLPLGSPGALHA